MLLVVDVGNTNTVLGVFEGDALRAHWRIETHEDRTADEYAVFVRQLLALADSTGARIDSGHRRDRGAAGAVRHRVVLPALAGGDARSSSGPGIKTGMPILYENPREVGADRIVNAVAAFERPSGGCIVVDFGTATTFDACRRKGEYLGGVIAPGIGDQRRRALRARRQAAARRDRAAAARSSARTPCTSMQSGIVFGYVGLVDALVERIRAELEFPGDGASRPAASRRYRQGVTHHRRDGRDADAARAQDPLRAQREGV